MFPHFDPAGLPDDPYYIRRTEVASSLLKSLHGDHARCIYEDRRMGKTLFLMNELTPLAEADGYKVIYHSFYATGGDREAAFILKLAREANDSLFDAASSWVTDKIAKMPFTAKMNTGVFEMNTRVFNSEDSYSKVLEAVFHELEGRKLLLILDEFQEIAKGPPAAAKASAAFIRSLRDCLDTRKPALKVIFAGSHQAALKRMFRYKAGAFFGFASEFDLPKFPVEVINELARRHHTNLGVRHGDEAVARLRDLFAGRFKFNPWRARRFLVLLNERPELSFEAVANQVMDELPDKPAFETAFNALPPLQRVIARGIAKGIGKPFGREALAYFSKEAKIPVNTSSAQAAIKGLCSGDDPILLSDDGTYLFNDPGFVNWLAELE